MKKLNSDKSSELRTYPVEGCYCEDCEDARGIAPSWESDIAALAVMAPVIFMQVVAQRAEAASSSA